MDDKKKEELEKIRTGLLPLLRCPFCKGEQLVFSQGHTFQVTFPTFSHHILCAGCKSPFPLTNDMIPVMWSLPMKTHFSKGGFLPNDNIRANISIYESVSSDYSLYSRRNTAIGKRIVTAVRRVMVSETIGKLHLDFGCGPGHVIEWLRELGMVSVGLDVSLENLRNVRQRTGGFVVCGDAAAMPFIGGCFDVVTESSALHHIEDWRAAITESCRVCAIYGGVVLDSEPSREQLDWSKLATAVFNARFPVYKVMSRFMKDKYMFRDSEQAKINLLAEIHHHPGTGFPVDEIINMFISAGFLVEVVRSPSTELLPLACPGWKGIVLNLLSARNPWDVKYGPFTAIARRS